MSQLLRTILMACIALSTGTHAQISPEILEDGRVTFRCNAGRAKTIQATGQFGASVALERNEQGLWIGTTKGPVAPGVYEYRLKVDGMETIDSRNPAIKPQRWPNTSILHIPSTPPNHWDLQKIPHGTIHQHVYFSKTLNSWREMVVYTPPNMATKDLPVLYLAHGYSDNQRTWTEHGQAHHILDSMIHEGLAKPMIVVMPDAHAIDPGPKKSDSYAASNTKAFCDELLKDVIPFIESRYPAAKSPEQRAFAGLSMGGRHALTVAINHSKHFSQVGAFSSAPPKIQFPDAKNIETINQQLELLWIACGDKDFLFKRNEDFHRQLKEHQVEAEYHVTKGDDHSWPVWRNYLIDFIPRIFQ